MMTSMEMTDSGPGRTILFASLILLYSCAPALAQANSTGNPPPPPDEGGTIQVTGQAQITVPADLARISFTVETEGTSAGEATEANAALMDAVIEAIRSIGLDDVDIQTFGYSLRPEYQVSREDTGTRTISGYRVQNNIRVEFSDVDAAGTVLDGAVEAGANRVANLQFVASDTRAARLQALREAVSNAREQAEAIASAMEVELGIALEVQGGASAPDPRSPGGIMLRASAEVATPVEAGDHLVTASVSIKYRILEEGS
ncbi:MAG: SIMPL domain-containing protein [Gemmatimonadota bacterium]|jgi:uncharacterized protein YggE